MWYYISIVLTLLLIPSWALYRYSSGKDTECHLSHCQRSTVLMHHEAISKLAICIYIYVFNTYIYIHHMYEFSKHLLCKYI